MSQDTVLPVRSMVRCWGMDLIGMLIASFFVFLGAAVQGAVGFGLGLIAAPLLMFVDTRLVPGPMLVLSFVFTQLVTFRDRKAIDLRGVGFSSMGRILGVVPAALLLPTLSRSMFDAVFGVLILGAVALSVWNRAPGMTTSNLVVAGGVSGFMGTISSVGGPPIALLYQSATGPRVRSTLGLYVLIGVTMSAFALALVGEFGWEDVQLGLLLVPGGIAGFLASGLLVGHVDSGGVRPYLLGLSFVAGLAVLIRGLLAWTA